MKLKRLLEILQLFGEQYPDAEVYVISDQGAGDQDYPICQVCLRFPGTDEDLPSVGLESV